VRRQFPNGKLIEKIWIGKTRVSERAQKLEIGIWSQSADHHSGQRLLERPHMKASQRCALDHFSKTVKILLALRAATTESLTAIRRIIPACRHVLLLAGSAR
jgi:hypothetical protein